MIIYKDALSGDEMISDSYDLKDIDDVVFEVDCKLVPKGGNLDINIGANASKGDGEKDDDEPAAEVLEEKVEMVNDIIDSFRLTPMPRYANKKDFAHFFNEYKRKLEAKLNEDGVEADKVTSIVQKMNEYAKVLVRKKIIEYEPYVGETMGEHQMPIYLNYRSDGETPYFTIWKHGLTEMKV